MEDFISRLKNGGRLVCDGAMGTSLQTAGLEPGQAPEEWNILKPDVVKGVHKGFIDAGCDMIITNTFGANISEELNKAGVRIAKEAAKDKIYVLGDIGPTGKLLKPIGDSSEEDFYTVFLKKAKALAGAGIDAFIIETMSALEELEIAVKACKKASGIPVIASMAFTQGAKGFRTMMGVSVEQAAGKMLELKCDVIGANCGCGSRQMVGIMKEFRSAVPKGALLIAQPNAGLPKLAGGRTIFDEPPAEFAKSILELARLGVNIIGGCCGTTPEHIREIVRVANINLVG